MLGTDTRWRTTRWTQTLRYSGRELRCTTRQTTYNNNFSLCVPISLHDGGIYRPSRVGGPKYATAPSQRSFFTTRTIQRGNYSPAAPSGYVHLQMYPVITLTNGPHPSSLRARDLDKQVYHARSLHPEEPSRLSPVFVTTAPWRRLLVYERLVPQDGSRTPTPASR